MIPCVVPRAALGFGAADCRQTGAGRQGSSTVAAAARLPLTIAEITQVRSDRHGVRNPRCDDAMLRRLRGRDGGLTVTDMIWSPHQAYEQQ